MKCEIMIVTMICKICYSKCIAGVAFIIVANCMFILKEKLIPSTAILETTTSAVILQLHSNK